MRKAFAKDSVERTRQALDGGAIAFDQDMMVPFRNLDGRQGRMAAQNALQTALVISAEVGNEVFGSVDDLIAAGWRYDDPTPKRWRLFHRRQVKAHERRQARRKSIDVSLK